MKGPNFQHHDITLKLSFFQLEICRTPPPSKKEKKKKKKKKKEKKKSPVGSVNVTDMFAITLIIFTCVKCIDIEYNKRLDRQRLCLEDDLTAGSNL